MNTKLIRIVRIASVELNPQEVEEISVEEFELLPEYKPSGREEEAEMLLRVGGKERDVDREMMKRSVDLLVEDGVFKEVRNIFKLFGVPLKPLVNGIEVDIRDKMMEEG
ncbi:MAG: hypothetical protein OEZ52_16265, partial [Candidatus Aminicenantes bacterium]|nr:hypothetical protein [Candidatus Aminicenantes bacterium]